MKSIFPGDVRLKFVKLIYKEYNIGNREHASIGAKILQDYVMTIDMVAQQVHFEIPAGERD